MQIVSLSTCVTFWTSLSLVTQLQRLKLSFFHCTVGQYFYTHDKFHAKRSHANFWYVPPMYLGISLSIPCRFLLCSFPPAWKDPHRSKWDQPENLSIKYQLLSFKINSPAQNMFGQGTPLLLDALKYPREQEAMKRSLSLFLLDLWKQASSQSQPVKYQRGVTKSAIYEKP